LPLRADQKDTDFDPRTDFLKFKTFTLRQAQLEAKSPELNSPIVRKRIEDAIRTQLTARGLTEVQNRPDLVVNFRLGATDKRQGVCQQCRRVDVFASERGGPEQALA